MPGRLRTDRTENDSREEPSIATPLQIAQYIRFALEQLPGENGHHKFEQLCLHLTRRRIFPNIVPSTGPVSAGGDQGVDFETYAVGDATGSDSPFFARVSHEKVVFACSLEKNVPRKIKADLITAANSAEKPQKLVFFSSSSLQVAKRHRLELHAKQAYGIHLTIFDARAISELLCDTEVFWIAQEFLSIPSNLRLLTPETQNKNYKKALALQIDPGHLTASDFFIVKNAARFATFSPDHRSDLPQLIKKLRFFRQHTSSTIRHKAFYEEFVAALRGMEVVQDLRTDLEAYLLDVSSSDSPSELEDVQCILSYTAGAIVRGLFPAELSFVSIWKERTLTQINKLLADKQLSPGRQCALLSIKGFLTMLDWTEALSQPGDIQLLSSLSMGKSVQIWRTMIRKSKNAPMFPLERFAKGLSELVGPYGNVQDFPKLVKETDSLLAKRFGKHKLAEQAFERSKSLLHSNRILDAIDELHKAHLHAFTKETADHYVNFCIFLSGMYSSVGLHCAAKCYALAAAFSALRLEDDSLRKLAYRGIAEAASSDHANGASLSFFLSASAFVFISNEYSMAGSKETKQSEWARIDFYCLLLTRAAALVGEELHSHLRQNVLPALGLDEIYPETVQSLNEAFDFKDISKVAGEAAKEGIMPPFSDVGCKRKLAWEQLGIRWFIEWTNDYETTKTAESFIAALQIFLVDIRKTELSILPGDVHIEMELIDGAVSIETIPDNERVRLKIQLQKSSSRPTNLADDTGMVHIVGTKVLELVSAISPERFLTLYENRLRDGLQAKLLPRATYSQLFEEFYGADSFARLHEKAKKIELQLMPEPIRTHPDLSGPTGTHPKYNLKESLRAIERRYQQIPSKLKYTLPRLLADQGFQLTVSRLRTDGWKDWHLLMAIVNIRQNYVMHNTVSPQVAFEQYREKALEVFKRDEDPSDPQAPVTMFSDEGMKSALTFSQMSTLKNLGFECSQQTPNLKGIDHLLRRFNYWTDDAPHQDPFAFE